MIFDFFVSKIEFEFEVHGSGAVSLYHNDIISNDFKFDITDSFNNIKILFTKNDPADPNSYAVLKKFIVNGGDFLDDIKNIDYSINKEIHSDAPDSIPNNLYFGYVGEMSFDIECSTTLLDKAAWILANNEFENTTWYLNNSTVTREKTFETILRDTKYMFTGCFAPVNPTILEKIENSKIKDLKKDLNHDVLRYSLEKWINESKRINLTNFSSLSYFTPSFGVTGSLESFLFRTDVLYTPEKKFHFTGKFIDDRNIVSKDLFNNPLVEESRILIELPAPYYDTNKLLDKIAEAKDKNCYVALDLTWLPITNDPIDLDLNQVDEIFFSMNKAWPVAQLRSGFRWCKTLPNDGQSFNGMISYYTNSYPSIYPNTGPRMFYKLMQDFGIDYAYDFYKPQCSELVKTFNLNPTSVLWFTTHNSITHDYNDYIHKGYYFLDEFVSLVNLLEYKNKYFW